MTKLNQKYSNNSLFKDIFNSNEALLIEIGAEWSGGSHLIAPILDKIEVEFNDRIKILKVEYDAHKEFLSEIGIECIPSIILVKDGIILEKISGTTSQKNLTRLVKNLVENTTIS